jgi:hypothetical protein
MALSQFKKDEIAFELRHEDDPSFHTKQFAARSKPAPKEYATQDVMLLPVLHIVSTAAI